LCALALSTFLSSAAFAEMATTPTQPATTAMTSAERLAQAEAKRPKNESFLLDNGLQVVVLPDHRAPVVTQMVWYRAGSADEKPGVSGIAHFLEHLMFKGTKTHPAGVFS